RPWSFELRWHEVEDGSTHDLDGQTLEFFAVDHAGHPTVGVAMARGASRVVYSCDTGPSNEVLSRARGASWLIHEAGNGVGEGGRPSSSDHALSFPLPHRKSSNGHSTVQEA